MRLSVLLAAAVLPASLRAQTARHPDPRYIQAPIPPTFRVSLTDKPVPIPFRLGTATLARFGDELDPDSTLLGDILAATILPHGRIAILDDKLFHLRLFTDHARPQQSIGRAGQGPGEFVGRLLSLASDSQARLLVADLSRTLKFFRPTRTGYQYESAVPLGMSPRAMCMLDGTLFALAPVAGHPEALHTFHLDGTKIRDFGPVYDSPNEVYNYQFIEGKLACAPQRQLAYFAPRDGFGEVRAYRPDGSLIWRTAIDGFLSNTVEDIANGFQVLRSAHGVHTVSSLTVLPTFGLLIQVAHRTPEALKDGSWYSTLTSFLLDLDSGRPACLGTSLPLIVAATADRVVLIGEDPVPHFEIHALTAP